MADEKFDGPKSHQCGERAFKSFSQSSKNTGWISCSGCTTPWPSEWITSLSDGRGIRRTQDRAKGSNNLAAKHFHGTSRKSSKILTWSKLSATSKVVMEPVGVVGIFTPWNSSAGSIAIKVAPGNRCRMHCRHQSPVR